MVATYPAMQPIETLITLAHSQPAGALADETHQSFPLPIRDAKGLHMAFFYCPAQLSVERGLQLLAPRHLALLNAATGKFEELRAVSPDEFGQKHVKSDLIGAYNMLPAGRTPEDFRSMYGRLQADYDALMPLLAAGETRAAPEMKKAAAEFGSLFPLLVEQPLLPYYYALGRPFFLWLNKLAA